MTERYEITWFSKAFLMTSIYEAKNMSDAIDEVIEYEYDAWKGEPICLEVKKLDD